MAKCLATLRTCPLVGERAPEGTAEMGLCDPDRFCQLGLAESVGSHELAEDVGLGDIRDRNVRVLIGCDQAGQVVQVRLGSLIPVCRNKSLGAPRVSSR